jgi:hypothetical protein
MSPKAGHVKAVVVGHLQPTAHILEALSFELAHFGLRKIFA